MINYLFIYLFVVVGEESVDEARDAREEQERRPRERQEQVRVLVLRPEELRRARLDEPDAQVDGEDFAAEVLRRDRFARLVEGRPEAVDAHITYNALFAPGTWGEPICRLLHVVATPPFKERVKGKRVSFFRPLKRARSCLAFLAPPPRYLTLHL